MRTASRPSVARVARPPRETWCPATHQEPRGSTARIDSVHWSDDKGSSWQAAELTGPNEPYGWVRFQFRWRTAGGRHTLMTRATDRRGSTQPASVPFNHGGYLFNAVHPHPVIVD